MKPEQIRLKAKRRRFNALLAGAHMMHAKEALLSGYNVVSTTELSEYQLDQLIDRVWGLINKKRDEVPKEIREWRHKCLNMIADCGVNTRNWDAVNAFMMDPRICGKHLYDLNLDELTNLHRKLHNVKINKDRKKADFERLKTLN